MTPAVYTYVHRLMYELQRVKMYIAKHLVLFNLCFVLLYNNLFFQRIFVFVFQLKVLLASWLQYVHTKTIYVCTGIDSMNMRWCMYGVLREQLLESTLNEFFYLPCSCYVPQTNQGEYIGQYCTNVRMQMSVLLVACIVL